MSSNRIFAPDRLRAGFFAIMCWVAIALSNVAIVAAQDDPMTSPTSGPQPPTLLAPEDGATISGVTSPPLGAPVLAWESSPEATKHQVQVSATDGFGALLVNVETENSRYTFTKALNSGVYYWRVRSASGRTWGEFSEIRSFQVDWSAGGVLRPVLLSPVDGALRSSFAPEDFSWSAAPGAATYRLQIALDPEMNQLVYEATTAGLHHTPQQRLANNIYYWRVTPVNNQGHAGAPSLVQSFTFHWNNAPQLLAPDNAVDLAFVPRFSWTAVEGAKEYRLQISTQENFNFVNEIVTRNTDYTPVSALSNDQDYFWRVQAIDARGTNSPWSEIRRFRMKWNFVPQLLAPANNSLQLSYPFFSWKPVPGAERYQIQIANNNAFTNPRIDDKTLYNVTNYVQTAWPSGQTQPETAYYWRVRAIDAQGNVTPWSETWSFQISDPTGDLSLNSVRPTSPDLIYPLPYYEPDAQNTPVHGDRSIAWPLFIWNTAHAPAPEPNSVEPADYYILEVDDNMDISSPEFVIQTAGLAAAPTSSHPFVNLRPGADYYWRVTAYKDGQPIGSRIQWRTRYDPGVSQLPVTDSAEAIYPRDGFEAAGHPPILGWLPVNGAIRYRVQIAADRSFTEIVDEATAQFVNYVPWQGKLTQMPYGAYWWRVHGEDAGGNPVGRWSAPRHFNLSVELTIGNRKDYPPLENLVDNVGGRTRVATNSAPSGDEYALHELFVTADRRPDDSYNQHWMIAFTAANAGATSITYAIYFDTDHKASSGGNAAPRNSPAASILVDELYWPEYVVYLDRTSGGVTAELHRWLGDRWSPAQPLHTIGGRVQHFPETNSYQLQIPYTALGSADVDWVGSLALVVFALDASGAVRDELPAQPGVLSKPVFVSNMPLPLYPFDTPLSNPLTYEEMPPLRWRMPSYLVDGYQVQVARDERFTDIVETWDAWEQFFPDQRKRTFTLLPTTFQSLQAYANNESYYWRVRFRHEMYAPSPRTDFDYGPWSPPMRFRLDSRQVGNPRISTGENAFMTPTFLWERVEGASGYTIQIDNDANFSSPLIDQATDATSFTPPDTNTLSALAPGVQYYWRVAMRRTKNILGRWSEAMTFTKSSLWPEPLAPLNDDVVNQQPTLRWTAVITPSQNPRLTVPAYRVQIADNPTFSPVRLDVTTQATSYTPPKGRLLPDGVWYWRVAFVDGAGRLHPFSPPQRFTKRYPLPSLLEPGQGETTGDAPIFRWAPIDGAAYYRLEYADNSSYNRSTVVQTDLTTYAPTKKLSNAAYFWRVQMFDADKNPGPLIEGRLFVGHKVYLPVVAK